MKRTFFRSLQLILAVSAIVTLSSCEDKALVQKNEDLRQRVSELEKEVDLKQVNAGENPGDQTSALKQANVNLTKALGDLEKLDDEKVKLEAAHAKLEKELRAYQKKYRIDQ